MEEQEQWVFYKDIDWNCPKNNRFNVDTRDFHCGYTYSEDKHDDISVISKYSKRFFFTEEELKVQLDRLYEESGGEGEWRCLELESTDGRVTNWNLKYIRIWRTDLGFLVCNSNNIAIPRHILSCKVQTEFLNHH